MNPPDYSPGVMARFASPSHAGALPAGPGVRLLGEAEALERRAWVRFEARIEEGVIADGRFLAWGCPHVIAACDLALERLLGGSPVAAAALHAQALADALEIPAARLGALLVVEDALRALAAAAARDK